MLLKKVIIVFVLMFVVLELLVQDFEFGDDLS